MVAETMGKERTDKTPLECFFDARADDTDIAQQASHQRFGPAVEFNKAGAGQHLAYQAVIPASPTSVTEFRVLWAMNPAALWNGMMTV